MSLHRKSRSGSYLVPNDNGPKISITTGHYEHKYNIHINGTESVITLKHKNLKNSYCYAQSYPLTEFSWYQIGSTDLEQGRELLNLLGTLTLERDLHAEMCGRYRMRYKDATRNSIVYEFYVPDDPVPHTYVLSRSHTNESNDNINQHQANSEIPSAGESIDADILVQKAWQLSEASNFIEAADLFRKVLLKEVDHQSAHTGLRYVLDQLQYIVKAHNERIEKDYAHEHIKNACIVKVKDALLRGRPVEAFEMVCQDLQLLNSGYAPLIQCLRDSMNQLNQHVRLTPQINTNLLLSLTDQQEIQSLIIRGHHTEAKNYLLFVLEKKPEQHILIDTLRSLFDSNNTSTQLINHEKIIDNNIKHNNNNNNNNNNNENENMLVNDGKFKILLTEAKQMINTNPKQSINILLKYLEDKFNYNINIKTIIYSIKDALSTLHRKNISLPSITTNNFTNNHSLLLSPINTDRFSFGHSLSTPNISRTAGYYEELKMNSQKYHQLMDEIARQDRQSQECVLDYQRNIHLGDMQLALNALYRAIEALSPAHHILVTELRSLVENLSTTTNTNNNTMNNTMNNKNNVDVGEELNNIINISKDLANNKNEKEAINKLLKYIVMMDHKNSFVCQTIESIINQFFTRLNDKNVHFKEMVDKYKIVLQQQAMADNILENVLDKSRKLIKEHNLRDVEEIILVNLNKLMTENIDYVLVIGEQMKEVLNILITIANEKKIVTMNEMELSNLLQNASWCDVENKFLNILNLNTSSDVVNHFKNYLELWKSAMLSEDEKRYDRVCQARHLFDHARRKWSNNKRQEAEELLKKVMDLDKTGREYYNVIWDVLISGQLEMDPISTDDEDEDIEETFKVNTIEMTLEPLNTNDNISPLNASKKNKETLTSNNDTNYNTNSNVSNKDHDLNVKSDDDLNILHNDKQHNNVVENDKNKTNDTKVKISNMKLVVDSKTSLNDDNNTMQVNNNNNNNNNNSNNNNNNNNNSNNNNNEMSPGKPSIIPKSITQSSSLIVTSNTSQIRGEIKDKNKRKSLKGSTIKTTASDLTVDPMDHLSWHDLPRMICTALSAEKVVTNIENTDFRDKVVIPALIDSLQYNESFKSFCEEVYNWGKEHANDITNELLDKLNDLNPTELIVFLLSRFHNSEHWRLTNLLALSGTAVPLYIKYDKDIYPPISYLQSYKENFIKPCTTSSAGVGILASLGTKNACGKSTLLNRLFSHHDGPLFTINQKGLSNLLFPFHQEGETRIKMSSIDILLDRVSLGIGYHILDVHGAAQNCAEFLRPFSAYCDCILLHVFPGDIDLNGEFIDKEEHELILYLLMEMPSRIFVLFRDVPQCEAEEIDLKCRAFTNKYFDHLRNDDEDHNPVLHVCYFEDTHDDIHNNNNNENSNDDENNDTLVNLNTERTELLHKILTNIEELVLIPASPNDKTTGSWIDEITTRILRRQPQLLTYTPYAMEPLQNHVPEHISSQHTYNLLGEQFPLASNTNDTMNVLWDPMHQLFRDIVRSNDDNALQIFINELAKWQDKITMSLRHKRQEVRKMLVSVGDGRERLEIIRRVQSYSRRIMQRDIQIDWFWRENVLSGRLEYVDYWKNIQLNSPFLLHNFISPEFPIEMLKSVVKSKHEIDIHYTLSIIGTDNSGKSSLLNLLCGTNFRVGHKDTPSMFAGLAHTNEKTLPHLIALDMDAIPLHSETRSYGREYVRKSTALAACASDVILLNLRLDMMQDENTKTMLRSAIRVLLFFLSTEQLNAVPTIITVVRDVNEQDEEKLADLYKYIENERNELLSSTCASVKNGLQPEHIFDVADIFLLPSAYKDGELTTGMDKLVTHSPNLRYCHAVRKLRRYILTSQALPQPVPMSFSFWLDRVNSLWSTINAS